MNFAALREFKKLQNTGIKDVIDFLSNELTATIRELRVGLTKLSFVDNFESFSSIVTIPASEEAVIRNELTSIPSEWIIVRMNEGGLTVCEGDTPWTLENLYLKNTGVVDAQITVRFFK